MMRRKLLAYTCMMTAGISAGYFITEKLRIISGALFLASAAACITLMDMEGGPDKASKERREKAVCLIFLILGFMLFTLNYARFESIADEAIKSDGEGAVTQARVVSFKNNGDSIRIILQTEKGRFYADYEAPEDMDLAELIDAHVIVRGEARAIRQADNPGCFDYRLYMRSKGVSYTIKANSFEISSKEGIITAYRKFLYKSKENFLAAFNEESEGFIRGVIFGDKSELEEETQREFNINSTGHILAVSGLHVGFLYSLMRTLSGRRRTKPYTILIILVLLAYGEMTQWSSPTVRAVIVSSLSLLSVNLNKRADLLTSVSAAALMILTLRPYMLLNTGFQMSFAAMISIAVIARPLSRYVGEGLAMMFSVQLGIIPITAYAFSRYNLLGVFINIPIIMLSSVLVPLCILLLFFSILTGIMPHFAVKIIELMSEGLVNINSMLTFNGSFSNLAAWARPSLVILIYILLFILFSEWTEVQLLRKEYRRIVSAVLIILIPAFFMCFSVRDIFRNDEIVFVSVGQGDCVHIKTGDIDALIDGGGSDFYNIGERTLMPYLLSQGAEDLDVAILTHLHADHFKGIEELSEAYPIKSIAVPSDYKNSFDEQVYIKVPQTVYLRGGSDLHLSKDVFVECLWPIGESHAELSADDANEHNMVYMIHYQDAKIMVTGDLLEEDELKMLEYYEGTDKLKCDILKVAHHGSKSSSSEAFLDAADPSIAVIQVGANNLYGHPHAQTLERLESRGIGVYRTDLNGAVGVDIKHKRKMKIDTKY